MDGILKSLSQQAGALLLVLLVVNAGLLYAVFSLYRRMKTMRTRWGQLLEGSSGSNLEILLENHLKKQLELQNSLGDTGKRLDRLEKRMQTTKRHLGVVTYNAFDDIAGSQSFALALYDDKGNGAILNSLVGRSECRVYCKPLLNGRSERTLSDEEERAILEAVNSAPRSIVS